MRALVFLFCIILSVRFVYHLQRINCREGWKWLIEASFDAFMIIVFAIIEKGRW